MQKEHSIETKKKIQDDLVRRGQYLVNIIGCSDCHTPNSMGPQGPVKDTSHYLGGYPSTMALPTYNKSIVAKWILLNPKAMAAVGPWGVSYAANISSDSTGIGNWTFDQFSKALREGKFKGLDGGRSLLPPMPLFRDLTDNDVQAIFAFLKSTRPVHNVPPSPSSCVLKI